MNGDQLRMARALLRLGIRELSAISGADKMAIVRIEQGRKPHAATLQKLKTALEERGIVFIGAVDPFHEATVAMRFGMQPPAPEENEDADEGKVSEPGYRTQSWDEVDYDMGAQQIEGMRAYWRVPGRWARLSRESKRALTLFMGGGPV